MRRDGRDEVTTGGPPSATAADARATGATGHAAPAPRGSLGLLRDRVYGPYWAAKLASTAGIWVHNVVAAIVTYQLTRSTVMVGAVTIAQFAPQLVFAPLSGAQADRGDPKRQLVAGRLIAALGSGALALAIAVVGVDGLGGAWPVIASAGVVGIGFVIGGPAMHVLLPNLVRPGELPAAVALNQLPPTIARSGGPVLGAFLLVTMGPAAAFGFTAATNLLFAAVVLGLPIGDLGPRAERRDSTVRGGLRYLRQDPVVAFLLLGILAIGFGVDPVVTLTPALSDAFGRSEELVGLFASAFGVGAALVFPTLKMLRARLGLARLGVTGLVLIGGGMALTAAAPVPAVAALGLAVSGCGFSFGVTGLTTRLYAQVPDLLRGRMMALWSVAFLGSRPVAAAINGAVTDATSVRAAFVVAAVAVLLIAAATSIGVRRADDGGG